MKKIITHTSVLLLCLLCVALFGYTQPAYAGEPDYGVNNPLVEDEEGVTYGYDSIKSTWDCIYFGSYYQSNSETKESIKWRVLSVSGNDALIISDKILNCQPFNESSVATTWKDCTLRTWFNNAFYNDAFNSEEKVAIIETTISTTGCEDTSDKVFTLSFNELKKPEYGFPSSGYTFSRSALLTDYARGLGTQEFMDNNDKKYYGSWWTRNTPEEASFGSGEYAGEGFSGTTIGGTSIYAEPIQKGTIGIRPALHIDLSKSVWRYAGTVMMNGNVTEVPNGICGDNMYWSLDSKGTLTISGTGEMQDCSWYSAPWYENRLDVKKIVIKEGVTALGDGAFENCSNLTDIIFPESIERINKYTFRGCTSLETVTIPESITEIEDSAFRDCSGMISLDIPTNITTIGPNAFNSCSKLESVYVPDTVVSVGVSAFWGVENAKIYIMKGSYIEGYLSNNGVPGATYTCKYGHVWNELYTVDTPPTEEEDGLESIHCSVCNEIKEGSQRSVTFDDAIKDHGTCGEGLSWVLTYSGKLTVSGTGEMQDCGYGSAPWYDYLPLIKTVIVEDGVTTIGRGAFENFYNIETVSLPTSISMISGSAFEGCKKIVSFTIPEGVKKIDGSAFSGCIGLTEIVIPNTVNTINGGAFWNCTGLNNVTIPDSVFLIGDRAFNNVTATFIIKKGSYADSYLQEEGKTIQYTCNYGHVWNVDYSIDVEPTPDEDGIESIHCSVCDQVKEGTERSVSLENAIRGKGKCGENASWSLNYAGLLTISGSGEMQDCGWHSAPWYDYRSHINTVVVADDITSIGVGAFEDCSELQEINLPDSITNIGNYAFAYCNKLRTFEVPPQVKTIEYGCFRDCYALTEFDIPSGVTSIGYNAFYNCTGLESLYIPDTVEEIGEYSFLYITGKVYVKKGSYADSFIQNEGVNVVYTCKYGHVWNEEYTVDTPATCIAEGSESIHCAVCNEKKNGSARAVDKIAHNYGEWNIIEEATCTEDGSREKVCSACGDNITETIIATGHDWTEEYIEDEPATCTADGVESQHCTKCSAKQNERAITAKGHAFGDWGIITPNSCVDSGLEQRECSVCHVTESRNLDPTGHDFENDYTIDKAPSCTEDGSKSKHCKHCDAVDDSQVIPATGHSYVETIHDSTCIEPGERIQKCSDCGDTITTVIDAKGHDMVHYDTVPATCTEVGYDAYDACSRCNYTEGYNEIAALGHTWKHYKAAAGLLKNGTEYDYCDICKTKKNVKTLTGYATYYVKSFKVAKAKKAFTAKWTKQSKANQKKFNGYQIRYSLKSDMSGAKYATAAKSSKSKKISKLKAKTKYYVQVRTYTKKNGTTFYSKWSAKKSIKTK